MKRHLNSCRECALETEQYSEMRENLRSFPKLVPTAGFGHATERGGFQGSDGNFEGEAHGNAGATARK